MGAEIDVGREAKFEISEAYQWYETRRFGLGESFLKNVDECFEQISQMSARFSRVQRTYRRARLKSFPYYVIFQIKPSCIAIVSVLHTSRDLTARLNQ